MHRFSPALFRFATWKSIFALICLLGVCGQARAQPRSVWIDTDVAIGSPLRDVDDAFALIAAWNSPELRVAGISTTYGNASLARTTKIARELSRRFGNAETIHPGAENANDSILSSPATTALIAASKKERITYLALGPLTNLAGALRVDPSLTSRLHGVIAVVGQSRPGRIRIGPWLGIHDANVTKDPPAMKEVLASGLPITLVPVENAIAMGADDFRALARGAAAARYLHRASGGWFWFWTALVRAPAAPVFDAGAVIAAARPEFVQTETHFARMAETGNLLVTTKPRPAARPVKWSAGFTREAEPWLRAHLVSWRQERR